MAAIISEAEVAAAIEQAFTERFEDMEDSSAEETPSETKIERMRCSFEPKNKYISDVDDMNEYVLSYFESLNHMSRRIITEQREVMAEQGGKWDTLNPDEQDKLIDERMVGPNVRKQYYLDDSFSSRKPEWFPVLRLAHGISGSEPNTFNPRDSIASVTEIHSKDQFSSPWSWETKSQQDLHLLLEEGELEEQLKNVLEADLDAINTTAAIEYKRREDQDFDAQSKDTSASGSMPGSEPLSRKEFLMDGLKYSAASSVQGSKASLSSSLHKGSKGSLSSTPPKGSKASLVSETRPKGSKASLVSETPPKGSKASLLAETPPKGSKGSLLAETPPKGSKSSLAAETPPKERKVVPVSEMPPIEKKPETDSKENKWTVVNVASGTPSLTSTLPTSSEPSTRQEDSSDSKEASAVDAKDVDVSAASNSNDLLAFLVNW